ncbi:PE domain-containing protein [Amycolatopsis sp. NEAU-NG30]|uniref:PE domain-containing protein n=1 Tax=Amycolatopsis melonis TaxID=3156488 RepID=A0ABV0LL63_9PSEU
MVDFAREVSGAAGYRVPVDDPSFRGIHATEMQMLQARLEQAASGGGGGGFKLDVEQMRALLPQWQELRDKLDDLRAHASELRAVAPPAADVASMSHNTAAKTHGDLYQRSIEQQWNYAVGYVNALEKMIKAYQESDGSASHSFNVIGIDL